MLLYRRLMIVLIVLRYETECLSFFEIYSTDDIDEFSRDRQTWSDAKDKLINLRKQMLKLYILVSEYKVLRSQHPDPEICKADELTDIKREPLKYTQHFYGCVYGTRSARAIENAYASLSNPTEESVMYVDVEAAEFCSIHPSSGRRHCGLDPDRTDLMYLCANS